MTEAIDLTTVGIVGSAQGYDLRGFLFDDRTDTYVVLLYRPYQGLDPYVTGRVRTLQDAEWTDGHYFSDRAVATRSMAARAGTPT
jgi:hypothetical protein